MTQEPFPFEGEQQSSILTMIREGMPVHDSTGDKIGTVDLVQYGADEDRGRGAAEPGDISDRADNSFVDDIANAFTSDGLPEAVRSRLLQDGFIRIDAAGLFAADRYVLSDQIADVSGGRVTLRVSRDELPKR